MADILERRVSIGDYRTMDLFADISELGLEARRRLMSLLYEFREREHQLQQEVLQLRRRLSDAERLRAVLASR